MTDRESYQEATMSAREAVGYAKHELGDALVGGSMDDLPRSVGDFLPTVAVLAHDWQLIRHEHGYHFVGERDGSIVNPRTLPGDTTRFWVEDDTLYIYMKKDGDYILIELRSPSR